MEQYAKGLQEDPKSVEWMEDDFRTINSVLRENGLVEHIEPRKITEYSMSAIEGFPYSFLHYLRRIYTLDRIDLDITPVNGELSEEDDELIMEAAEMMDSHLLCHSDAQGYYVPIDFDEVLFDEKLPGGMLGSSQRLFSEILKIAHLFDIEVIDGNISKLMKNELAKADESHPYYIERIVWFSLFENCKNSIENNTLISFE